MPEYETKTREEKEEAKRRKKAQPEYDDLKQAAQVLVGLPLAEQASLLNSSQVLGAQRIEAMLRLQQVYGNRYVQASAGGKPSEGNEFINDNAQDNPFRVVNLEDGGAMSFDMTATMDGKDAAPVTEGESEGEQELEPVGLPLGGAAGVEDAVSGQIGLFHTIRRGELALGEAFGMAEYVVVRRTWVRQRRLPNAAGSRYDVKVRTTVRYTWDVDSQRRKHIQGSRDPDVTEDSWSQIVYDLRPSAATPCRSPREEYWCRDLTTKHEKFHIEDWIGAFRTYRPSAEAWLKGQSASSLEDAYNKAGEAVELMITDVNTYMGSGDSAPCEVRAYNDGAPLYEARAKSVEDRATKEEWQQGIVIQTG